LKVIDSSGWLEYFIDGPLAEQYALHLDDPSQIITPTIVVYEVYKRVKHERSEQDALLAVSQLRKTWIVPLTTNLALEAADVNSELRLAKADSVVYATAVHYSATLFTSDEDFSSLRGVVYYKKPAKT
jgi:predicted nucleic acid-binding protein